MCMRTCSVLMPIYNASTYLRQSLDSVTNQTLTNIEVICINDGSTDNSLEIIREYAEKDSRIVIIDKPNSGYGDSMNRGLDIAKGKYIAILEPDDWYETSMLKTLYSLATQNNLDVAKCDFYQYSNQTKRSKQYHLFKSEQCSDILNENQTDFIYSLQPSIWSAIYRRSFLNKNNPEQYRRYVKLWQEANLFLLPTQAECAGIVYCEASAYGVPIFTYDTGGIGDYVVDGVNGYKLPPTATAADFAACIKRNLDTSSLQALHEGCLSLYKDKLSWSAWSRRFREIMEENGMA